MAATKSLTVNLQKLTGEDVGAGYKCRLRLKDPEYVNDGTKNGSVVAGASTVEEQETDANGIATFAAVLPTADAAAEKNRKYNLLVYDTNLRFVLEANFVMPATNSNLHELTIT